MNLLQLLATGAPAPQTYIEDVFSAYTYTGNGIGGTITNGIDLAGEGGMVWCKIRSSAGFDPNHALFDTLRGINKDLKSNTTDAQGGAGSQLVAFNSNGFELGGSANVYENTKNFASWTFREAAKFFDVVTYTGNGANRTIAHSLGIAPGMIIIKRTDSTNAWKVYHRSLTSNAYYLVLNTTAAEVSDATMWNSTTADATTFSLGTHADVNTNTAAYVAYLFAHDTSSTGLIQCGSFTTDGSGNATVSLGWEPQYVMMKTSASANSGWLIEDSMRGLTVGVSSGDKYLEANNANAEAGTNNVEPTATGFNHTAIFASQTFIYLAIRRGPMRQPTVGTQVYKAINRTSNGTQTSVTGVGFAPDLLIVKGRGASAEGGFWDRLRGPLQFLYPERTSNEYATAADALVSFDMDGATVGADAGNWVINNGTMQRINHFFKRAPGVFDQVCYTGTGSAHTEAHNLTVVPELMIVKRRSTTAWDWAVYAGINTDAMFLNTTAATSALDYWNNTSPTATVFTVNNNNRVNESTKTYVAYLFATLAGISKVGTYTGNGSTQNIEMGFSAGARFFLVKATSTTGNWVVFDTVRGVVAGNDPYLLLNSTAAEDTDEDAVDSYAGGITVNEISGSNINTNAITYIYLAFA